MTEGGERLERRHHIEYLVLCGVAVLLSFVLSASGDKVLAPVPGGARALPPLCPMKALTGWDCPGCGLTRSFVAFAHGDVAGSLHYHRVGIALFLVAAYHVLYRTFMVIRGGEPPAWLALVHRWIARGLVAALMGNWILRVFLHI